MFEGERFNECYSSAASMPLDLCKGQSRGIHQVMICYAKRCLGLVKGVCPYLDDPAVVKEVIKT